MSRNTIKNIVTPNGNAIIDEVNDAVRVNVVTGGGSSGTEYADGAARGTATGTLAMGDDGTNVQSVKVDTAGVLAVQDNGGSLTVDGTFWQATQPVSAATLPLPTGAATAALQTQPGVDIGDVTVNNASGVAAVNIQDGGNSITVDGSVSVSNFPATYPVTDNSGSLTVDIPDVTTSAKAVTASTSGDTTVHTPTASNRIKLGYICLSADGANSADTTVIVKFTAGGSTLYKISLKAGAIWARNIGAGQRYLDGGVNNALIVNLSAAQTVNVSIEYTEST